MINKNTLIEFIEKNITAIMFALVTCIVVMLSFSVIRGVSFNSVTITNKTEGIHEAVDLVDNVTITTDSLATSEEVSSSRPKDSSESNSSGTVYPTPSSYFSSRDRLVFSAPSIRLGGSSGSLSTVVGVSLSSGGSFGLLSANQVSGIDILTRPNNTEPLAYSATKREITISLLSRFSSGSGTVVLQSPEGYSGSLTVQWDSFPDYSVRQSHIVRTDYDDVINYNLGFTISPNEIFGNPIINYSFLSSYPCINHADPSKSVRYNGNNQMSIDCMVERYIPTPGVPSPLSGATVVRVQVDADIAYLGQKTFHTLEFALPEKYDR
jgi:hypothetical protein